MTLKAKNATELYKSFKSNLRVHKEPSTINAEPTAQKITHKNKNSISRTLLNQIKKTRKEYNFL